MIDNPVWEEIFTNDTPYNLQLLIEVSGGTYLTNTEIASESFSLTEMLSDNSTLRFGGCNASQLKLRIRSSVKDMTNKTIVAKVYSYEDANIRIVIDGGVPKAYNVATGEYSTDLGEAFVFGTYRVRTDKPTPEKDYRDISAFDALERVVNEDIGEWYRSFWDTYDGATIKFIRESLLAYFGIEYEPFTGVNDDLTIKKTIETNTISAVSILRAICELNGCFGYITRDNKFRCRVLSTETVDKTYYRYKQGGINYQDALANVITQVQIYNDLSKANASIGVEGNAYIIAENVLLTGLDNFVLEDIATKLLPVVSGCVYRPFTCQTYGDPCVELGDFIKIPTSDKTVESFLLQRELTGTQAMRDKIEAKGEEKNASGATGSSATISQLYSSMSKVNEQSNLAYYVFHSATSLSVEDGESPTRIARIRYANTKDTTVDIWHEFLMNVSFSDGSDRCKVYVYYYYDDVLIDYQPIETYGLDDMHVLNLNYAYNEVIDGFHTWEVYLATEGGNATIGIGDANITLRGQGLVVKTDWDGIIEVSDEYSVLYGSTGYTFGYEDECVVRHDIEVYPKIEINEEYSATYGTTGYGFDYAEDVTITSEYSFNAWGTDANDNVSTHTGDILYFRGHYTEKGE